MGKPIPTYHAQPASTSQCQGSLETTLANNTPPSAMPNHAAGHNNDQESLSTREHVTTIAEVPLVNPTPPPPPFMQDHMQVTEVEPSASETSNSKL